LFCTDIIIVLISAFVFGIETGLFSALGLLAKAFIVDGVIESMNLSKSFIIITEKPGEISNYIKTTLHRGATVWKSTGAFSDNEKTVVLSVLNRTQAMFLKKYVKFIDKHAFIIISNTSDIIGKGFRESI